MPKFKITIEYEGSDFVGWQKQENGLSIQETIEDAVYKLTGETVTLFGAGRTDAGVHAKGQVAHFDLIKYFESDEIRDGLNQHLRPLPIAIIDATEAGPDFHARFSAKKRSYEYLIINRRSPLTINKNRAWCVFKKLDLDTIYQESKSFIGNHNFQAFRSVDCQATSPKKTIDEVFIKEKHEKISISISAKSFLHSQVRIMVGTLIEIGKGKITKSVKDIILSQDRAQAGVTAPACGLYLLKVDY
jgi:tRNA pseudouridine38-40 synthase